MSVKSLDNKGGFLAVLLGVYLLSGAISCGGDSATGPESPSTGTIEVTVSTIGVDGDPDGYLVIVDGSRSQRTGFSTSVTFSDVTAGQHTVELTDLASNCSVGGDNPRSVIVTAGETAQTAFAVICTGIGGNTGSIEVSTLTTGVNLDPDGYTVSIFGFGSSRIDTNATVVIPGLAPGDYELRLSDLASNCLWVPRDDAFQVATVSAGTTARVTFDVTCFDAPLGTLRLRISTTGPPPFPPFYFVGIDGQTVGAVGVNGAASFRLPAGAHSVGLAVPSTCSVADNGRTVVVVSGTTVEITFNVTC